MSPASFDRFMERLAAAATGEWTEVLVQFQNMPMTLAVVRWHYETNMSLRQALSFVESSMCKKMKEPLPESGSCELCGFSRSVVAEFARHHVAASKTVLREASMSAHELTQAELVMRAFVALASHSSEIEGIVRIAMRRNCKAFNDKKFLVVPPKN